MMKKILEGIFLTVSIIVLVALGFKAAADAGERQQAMYDSYKSEIQRLEEENEKLWNENFELHMRVWDYQRAELDAQSEKIDADLEKIYNNPMVQLEVINK